MRDFKRYLAFIVRLSVPSVPISFSLSLSPVRLFDRHDAIVSAAAPGAPDSTRLCAINDLAPSARTSAAFIIRNVPPRDVSLAFTLLPLFFLSFPFLTL